MIKVVGFKKLKNNTKKYEITFQKNGKKYIRKFGAAGMSDYTIHKDRERRERYISRHKKDLKTNDPMKPGYLSMFILWNKPSLSASLADYKRRLNVYNKTGKFPIGITGSKKLSFGGLFDGTSLSKLPPDILQLINQHASAMVIQDTSKEYNPKRSLIEELKIEGLKRYKTSLALVRRRPHLLQDKEFMKNFKKDIYKYISQLWTNLDPVESFTAKWLTRASKVLVKKDFDFRTRNFWWKVIEHQLSSMNEIEEDGNPDDILNEVEFEYYEKCKRAIIVILNTVGAVPPRITLGNATAANLAAALAAYAERRTNDFGSKKSLFGAIIPFDETSLGILPGDIREILQRDVSAYDVKTKYKKYLMSRERLVKELKAEGLKIYTEAYNNYIRRNDGSPMTKYMMEAFEGSYGEHISDLWMNLDPVNDFTAKWLTRASKILTKTDFNFETKDFWWKVIEDQLDLANEIETRYMRGEDVLLAGEYLKSRDALKVILRTAGYIDAGGDLDNRPETPWTAHALAWWKTGIVISRRIFGNSLFGDSPIPDNVVNKKLYASIKSKIKKSTIGRRWGAYDSGRLVREYKAKGGKYKGGKGKGGKGKCGKGNSNLGRWYKEKWVDACARPRRKSCSNKSITYCRPSKKVDAKTPKLVQQFTRAQLKARCAKKKKNPMTRVTNFGMPPSRKDNIPVSIKEQVWLRDCHRADPRIAQCKTCLAVVKYPQSLSRHFPPNELLPYNVSGTGEYGHLIAEAQGGRVTVENLFIQCKSCNTSLGANTAELRDYNDDQFMLERSNDDNMLVDSGIGDKLQCIAITGKNVQCKNTALGDRSLCGIHCKY